ncbi:hypothetical protein FGO68_gene8913 [Halteria grandinella]|uniref:RING-type domain-containing protein n=1 Tax=Halteria grandinella TaxID=5974 RepID=A0A8J8NRV6_HALGN|nr:hypothetical protein FGO68_gene8913 [Halteria grandinella]
MLLKSKKQIKEELNDEALSPRLVHPSQDALDQHFECKICYNVLPLTGSMECSKCQIAYCGGCLKDYWKHKGNLKTCPLNCKDPQFRELHRFFLQKLSEIYLNCKNKGCQETIPYSQYKQHLKDCKFVEFNCDCGKSLAIQNITQHAQYCHLVKVKCNKCSEIILFTTFNTHDCLSTLKSKLSHLGGVHKYYEDTVNLYCPQRHLLYPCTIATEPFCKRRRQRGQNVTQCDICAGVIMPREMYWRCLEACDEDVCCRCFKDAWEDRRRKEK